MRTLAGPSSQVLFTALPKSLVDSLSSSLKSISNPKPVNELQAASFTVSPNGIMGLLEMQNVSVDKVCLLDPKAEKSLSPEDGNGQFTHFLFGGILGDDPPRDRTSELRALGFPRRHLGPVQMTTDTALGVTKLVVQDKKTLEEIAFTDSPTIRFNARESVEMPFRYIVSDGQPLLPPGMRELLQKDLDQEFEFWCR